MQRASVSLGRERRPLGVHEPSRAAETALLPGIRAAARMSDPSDVVVVHI
jgi:hypothetical protein